MTATQTNATIHLSSPRLTAAAEHLLLHSALASCAEITGDQLVTVRPVSLLKPDQLVLWRSLERLASGRYFYETHMVLQSHPDLDVPNRAALATAVAMWEAAS